MRTAQLPRRPIVQLAAVRVQAALRALQATGFTEPRRSIHSQGLGAYEETERLSDTRSRHAHQQRPARPCRCVHHVSPRL